MKRIFPEYLNKGSEGAAVKLLQAFLLFGGLNETIELDGIYGDETANGVVKLQGELGFKGSDLDGHFGPATRARLLEQRSLNIDELTDETFAGATQAIVPE